VGYDVHIERATCPDGKEPLPITLEEWTGLVEHDPDIQMTPVVEVVNPKTAETISWRSEGMATWTARTEVDGRELTMVLIFGAGRITARFPYVDDERIRKLHAMANALGAFLHGDAGEIYREDGFSAGVDSEGIKDAQVMPEWNSVFPSTFGGSPPPEQCVQ